MTALIELNVPPITCSSTGATTTITALIAAKTFSAVAWMSGQFSVTHDTTTPNCSAKNASTGTTTVWITLSIAANTAPATRWISGQFLVTHFTTSSITVRIVVNTVWATLPSSPIGPLPSVTPSTRS